MKVNQFESHGKPSQWEGEKAREQTTEDTIFTQREFQVRDATLDT